MNYAFDPRLYNFNSDEHIKKEYDLKLTNLPEQKYNPEPLPPFLSREKNEIKQEEYPYHGILGNVQDSAFSLLFFSRSNIEELQVRIRNEVYLKSYKKYKIGKQNDRHLVNVMVDIYQTYGYNEIEPSKFKDSISYLNDLVVKQVAPQIVASIKSHQKYLEDKSKPYGGGKNLLPAPEVTTITGTRMYS